MIRDAGLAEVGLLRQVVGDPSVAVAAVTMDSRRVAPGSLFACVPGQTQDGHVFAPSAVADGAVALLCERVLEVPVPQIVVSSVRRALGPVADAVYDHPSAKLTVAAVTGTNGKTTTCALLRSVFEANGWPATTVGTLTHRRTTPEAPELHALLADWHRDGGRAVAMEVSSHALEQHRTDSVHFAAGVFTNLTPEHLDYHGTMDAYFEAKARLFEPGRVGVAVVNRDDPWGRRLMDRVGAGPDRLESFGLDDAEDLVLTPSGSRFRWSGQEVELRVGGAFNVANALAAATCAAALGVDAATIGAGLSAVATVPGRFQLVDAGQPFTVVVDYAHTPDGLAKVLDAARQICRGGLIAVFGAGGDRDRDKRPLMGRAAAGRADLVVVTSDNPRSEDPDAIISEVLAGTAGATNVIVDADRASAIATALANARPGDVVVIAGKGHEKGQEIGGRVLPFDDAEVAASTLRRILASRRDDQ
ncbi:MAG TPA: UDP-N-acetylmuramoyl-L-alanyl-D-glutamate--2,6-diaminopimelate ligase [Acidimicrobiales bacterium]|nr:UDP-N-acetylmuramoyl-L-alanyl-D-glutamate--2,6-diaminopimelate ligase [Acidimicrobiales bacterium]